MPADVKNMANIQCEDCHGPAGEHVATGAKMATSMDSGVCDQCHNGGGHHLKGTDLHLLQALRRQPTWPGPYRSAPPSRPASAATPAPAMSPSSKAPDQPASWDNSDADGGLLDLPRPAFGRQRLAAAHHRQARSQITFDAKDQGLSATCRSATTTAPSPANAVKGSYPHYSSAAEFLNDTGGVDYGQKLPASPHAHDGRPAAHRQPGRCRRS